MPEQFRKLPEHIVQSPTWGEFKTAMGTPTVQVGGVQFTKHKIPGLPYFFGYCPKVDPSKIDFGKLQDAARKHHCALVRFDIPNVLKTDPQAEEYATLFWRHGPPAPKDTFAKHTILLDLTPNEETLFTNLHSKVRYNTRLAQRKGVAVEEMTNEAGLKIFLQLQRETAQRQGFFIHPNRYFETMLKVLGPKKMMRILVAKVEDTEPHRLVAWILFHHEGVLYYPYGGSSNQLKNYMASNLMMWEAIKLGKKLNCQLLDMWGAAPPDTDQADPWHGFTDFKLKYGGQRVEFLDSRDLIINRPIYHLFNLADKIRWTLLNLKRKL